MRPRPSRSSRSSTPPMRAQARALRTWQWRRPRGEYPRKHAPAAKHREAAANPSGCASPMRRACSASSINSRNARWAGGSSTCRAVSIAVKTGDRVRHAAKRENSRQELRDILQGLRCKRAGNAACASRESDSSPLDARRSQRHRGKFSVRALARPASPLAFPPEACAKRCLAAPLRSGATCPE